MASGTGYPMPGTADCDSLCAARIDVVSTHRTWLP
jgi:hypothetical protein